MRLIDQFERPDPNPDNAYTFVFDTRQGELNNMLVMGQDGFRYGYWTRGQYDPKGANERLGKHVELRDLGAEVLDAFFFRLSIPQEWEEVHNIIEQIIREDDDE